MRLGSTRQRDRKRRQRRFLLGLFKWGFFLGLIVAAGAYAWYTGSKVVRHEVVELTSKNQALESEVTSLRSAVADGQAREALLNEQIPAESEQKILEIARRKIGEGVAHERLAEILSAATAARRCDNAPTSRRFLARTHISGGDGTSATFADNTITVKAEGEAATNGEGKPEAWYDQEKPVTITFIHLNGAATRAEGRLPLTHSIAVGGHEYRFQITDGPRGFVIATMDRCAYP